MAARVGLVDIVRDFIVVHHRFQTLFSEFRDGGLEFETVRRLVADSDASVLFRLKERVHRKFRNRDPDLALRRGEALFDLAVGSLFHEALKFRENLYQLKVYGPKVRGLRDQGAEDGDGLLAEFEKLLRAVSDRLGESLRETESLLEQTRRQLPALILDFARDPSGESRVETGLVARFLFEEREAVEAVYPEGVPALLAQIHDDLLVAYALAVRSHLASAHFGKALELISEAGAQADSLPDEFRVLEAYASGMQAFLDGRYSESVERLRAWSDSPGRAGVEPGLARAAMGRLPELLDRKAPRALIEAGREIVKSLGA
jgi:hypothetical protein